jgi:glycosyltransferase involved in cell wall biosynthesis
VKNPSGTTRRLAVVLSHPTQYYSPWFQWLRRETSLEFRVFYLWDFGTTSRHDPNFGTSIQWDVDLLAGYDSEFVPNRSKHPGAEHFWGFDNPDLPKRLKSWRPDSLLLFGYKWSSHLRAVAWATLNGIPILFRGDSHLLGRARRALHVSLSLRLLFAQFACFLYVGAANREYFERFGVPDRKLFFAPHSVNAALFDRNDATHLAAAATLRIELGLSPATTVVLFAGKLVAGKQPMELLEAFASLRPPDTALIFVGDGAERKNLEAAAARVVPANSATSVHFLNFANQSEMPSRYLLADLFVLPSLGETWGLAINEAMHMGVPCVVSNRVGCQRDLVTDGETGWVFEAGDPGGLRGALSTALRDVANEARMMEIIRAVERRISNYTYRQTTDGLLRALSSLHA